MKTPSLSGHFEDEYGDKSDDKGRTQWKPHPVIGPTKPVVNVPPVMGDFKFLQSGQTYVYNMEFGSKVNITSSISFTGTNFNMDYKVNIEGASPITESYPNIMRDLTVFYMDWEGSPKNTIPQVYPWWYRMGNHPDNPQVVPGTNFVRFKTTNGQWWIMTPLTVGKEGDSIELYQLLHAWEDNRMYYYYHNKTDEYNTSIGDPAAP